MPIRKRPFLKILSIIALLLILSSIYLISLFFRKIIIEGIELANVKSYQQKDWTAFDSNFRIGELIAHGGGEVYGLPSTNSLEALEENYKKGIRFFELDLELTADNQLVALHDWSVAIKYLFSAEPGRYSLNEFKKLNMVENLTPLTPELIVKWFSEHPDAYLITDGKQMRLLILKQINQTMTAIKERIIPQVYTFSEYLSARNLGFNKIILALYIKRYFTFNLIKFLKVFPVTAVSIEVDRLNHDIINKLGRLKVPVLAHTVNNPVVRGQLKSQGVWGFYLDYYELTK